MKLFTKGPTTNHEEELTEEQAKRLLMQLITAAAYPTAAAESAGKFAEEMRANRLTLTDQVGVQYTFTGTEHEMQDCFALFIGFGTEYNESYELVHRDAAMMLAEERPGQSLTAIIEGDLDRIVGGKKRLAAQLAMIRVVLTARDCISEYDVVKFWPPEMLFDCLSQAEIENRSPTEVIREWAKIINEG